MLFILGNYDMLESAAEDFCALLIKNGVSESSVFKSRLVITELVGNIFRHSEGSARLSAELDGSRIIIKVTSDKKYRPPEKSACPGVYEESGRGLYIVDCVSEERSFTLDGEIKVTIKADFNE